MSHKISPVSWFRTKAKPALGEYKYSILLIMGIAVSLIGYAGFSILYPDQTVLNKIYLTLQLFTLGSGNYSGPAILPLDVARILAPIFLYVSIFAVVADKFYHHLELLWLRLITRNHIIICGLGYVGSALVHNSTIAEGSPTVVIEKDPSNKELEWCQKQGITVIIGDATEPQILRQANLRHAKEIYVATGDDDNNAKVIVQIDHALTGEKDRINCYVHIVDPYFTNLLQVSQLSVSQATPLRLEFFNMYQIISYCMIGNIPELGPFGTFDSAEDQVMIIGLGRMGESLVFQLAKRWKRRYEGSDQQRIKIAIVDRDAEKKKALLEARSPGISDYCEIIPYEMELISPEFYKGRFLEDSGTKDQKKIIFLCLTDESLNLSTGMHINQQLHGSNVQIIIRTVQNNGFAQFFDHICPEYDEAIRNIQAFPISCPCFLETLTGINELLARSLHDNYQLQMQRNGALPESDPALKPWNKLDIEYQEANRDQADHIVFALRSIGYSIVAQTDFAQLPLEFSKEDIELLAEKEHQRWNDQKTERGWKLGPRELGNKTSPYLVPWSDLDEKTREVDRNFVKAYPSILASVYLKTIKDPKGENQCRCR